jgi:outer membrane protein insertion porin family
MARAQIFVPAAMQDQTTVCAPSPSSAEKRPSGPEVIIAELNFEGDLRMPNGDLEQIATSLKQQRYFGDPDAVTSEVLERVRLAWQNQGYFEVEVLGEEKILTSSPAAERISISVHVEAGQQYRLEEIRFRGNRKVSNVRALRPLFPLKDGDVFDRAAIAKGLDQLRFAYGQLGYINFTSIPNTQFNEDRETISLVVEFDEGKKFYVSSLNVLGRVDSVLKDSLIKEGDVYDERLVNLFVQQHAPSSVDASLDSRIHRQLDESAGTVAITFDLRDCPFQEQP